MTNFLTRNISAETQSGLPFLPWSCYASVIQCDIIQYLMFLFYYNTGIISFLAIYNDTILQGSGNPIICRFRPILNSWDRFIFSENAFLSVKKNAFWPIINVFSNTVS